MESGNNNTKNPAIKDSSSKSKVFKERGKKGKPHGNPKEGYKPAPKNNDVNWYKRTSMGLYEQATTVSKYHTTGYPLKLRTFNNVPTASNMESIAPFGVMNYTLEISFGELRNSASPANRAALNLFNLVRGKYTNTVPFQAQDILCYIGAIGSVIALQAHMAKILNWVNIYEPGTITMPYGLFESVNIDYTKLRTHYADLVYRFSTEVTRLQCLTKPAQLSYFDKLKWAFADVWYTDTSKHKGNMVHFSPSGVWKWSSQVLTTEGDSIFASGLEFVSLSTVESFDDLLSIFSDLIDALVNNDDVRTISGWLHQYVDNGIIEPVIDFVNKEAVYPAQAETLKYQLMNCKFGPSTHVNGIIAQSVNDQCLIDDSKDFDIDVTDQFTRENCQYWLNSWVMNFPAEPTADLVMEATRFIAIAKPASIGDDKIEFIHDILYPSDLKYTYYRSESNTWYSTSISQYLDIYQESDLSWTNYIPVIRSLQLSRYADYYPPIVCVFRENEYYEPQNVSIIFDTDFAFELEYDSIADMHEVALLSEFSISQGNISKK